MGVAKDFNLQLHGRELEFLNTIRKILEDGDILNRKKFIEALETINFKGDVRDEPMWTIVKIFRSDPHIRVFCFLILEI